MAAKTGSILVVEDDRDFETLVLRALRNTEFADAIVLARNASEAMAQLLPAAGSASSRPSAVFLDLSLPSLDGLDLLRCIRADYAIRSLPVVVFSGSLQDEDIRRAYLEGANSYVRKPIGADELAEAVRLLVTYWLKLNEPPPRI